MIDAHLEFENRAVLSLVQALIGAVSPRMLAVAIYVDHESPSIDAYFALSEETEQERDLIKDIVSDFSSLVGTHIPLSWHGCSGSGRTSTGCRTLRLTSSIRRLTERSASL